MAKKKKRKHGITPDLPIIIDYGGDLVSVYDPGVRHAIQRTTHYGKDTLQETERGTKGGFQVNDCVCCYRLLEREPTDTFRGGYGRHPEMDVEAFAEEYGILMKEDSELKRYLMTLVISILNKCSKRKRQHKKREIRNPSEKQPSYGIFFFRLWRITCSAKDVAVRGRTGYAATHRRQSDAPQP